MVSSSLWKIFTVFWLLTQTFKSLNIKNLRYILEDLVKMFFWAQCVNMKQTSDQLRALCWSCVSSFEAHWNRKAQSALKQWHLVRLTTVCPHGRPYRDFVFITYLIFCMCSSQYAICTLKKQTWKTFHGNSRGRSTLVVNSLNAKTRWSHDGVMM